MRSLVSVKAALAIAKTELIHLRRDSFSYVLLLGVPLIVVTFTVPTYRVLLRSGGEPGATGAEQAVPGMAVLFGLVIVGSTGYVFFREHGWNTWSRLRLAVTEPLVIIAGKIVAPLVMVVVQQTALLTLGLVFFGLDLRAVALSLLIVTPMFALMIVGLGLLLTTSFRTLPQMQAVQGIMTILFTGLGGALTPRELLPWWARAISPWTPGYSAVQGYRELLLHDDLAKATSHAAALAAFAIVFFTIATRRFNVDGTKEL